MAYTGVLQGFEVVISAETLPVGLTGWGKGGELSKFYRQETGWWHYWAANFCYPSRKRKNDSDGRALGTEGEAPGHSIPRPWILLEFDLLDFETAWHQWLLSSYYFVPFEMEKYNFYPMSVSPLYF